MLVSCNKSNQENQLKTTATINLPYKVEQCDSIENYCILLDSIIEDSRCPTSAICIWEGRAIAKFLLTENAQQHNFNLELQKDTTINNYKIAFLELTPNPTFDSTGLHANYTATLKIEH